MGRGNSVVPIKNSSTEDAQLLPSAIAQTIND
ncbi:uncharacterized protein METZ01_LOCUS393047 [marine metagenome]|uniref:Uncharacterized protein n=1 Tax=marine metagenome TaxID=408172 RepID=A0A382V136_9ZZZZ